MTQCHCRQSRIDQEEAKPMSPFMQSIRLSSLVLAFWLVVVPARAQQPTAPQDSFLLTIFLKHDQSKTLDQINEQLKRQDYLKKFPPEGIEVVSWYIMMGIGQVVTLRVPAARLREVNRAVEQSAWGAYRTEFYPTYDYKAVAEQERRRTP
jgi:hypothetical protein